MKKQEGITLIALVITIIVLLILAGVSIAMLIGENGILNQTDYAKYATKIGEYKDKVSIYVSEEQINSKENAGDVNLNLLDSEEMKKILGNIEDGDKFVIQENELRYRPEKVTDQEEEWLIKLNVAPMESLTESTPLGNYLVDNTTYCDTLQEALNIAVNGSTIRIMKDTEENDFLTINKDVNIDLNEKTISCNDKISIDSGINVVIDGNGKIDSSISGGSFILNNGNLEVKNSTISSSGGSGTIYGTISNSGGNLIIDNSTIIDTNGSTAIVGGAVINNGNIEGSITGQIELNGGSIAEIDFRNGGNCTINSGTVDRILMGSNMNDIHLTIGNINEAVNDNNPQIGSIEVTTGDLAGITCNIDFYNGIIKQGYSDTSNEGDFETYNIRPGYKVETTSEGAILVAE